MDRNPYSRRYPTAGMASEPCDGCGRRVSIAGGIANLWSFERDTTDGLELELGDGSEYFLCFDCVDDLPDDPTAADVAALPNRPLDAGVGGRATGDDGAGDLRYVGFGIAVGAGVGAAVGVATGDVESWLATGAAVGLGVALLAGRLAERRRA